MRESSIAARLFLSAAFWSAVVLFIAGIVLSTIYRRTTLAAFDERLNVYIKELVADLASPSEGEKTDMGNLGEPRFQLQNSGWYWQILKTDGTQVKVSRSLFGQRLATLGDAVPLQSFEPWKRGYINGPDDRRLRVIERPIDLGEEGQFIINVAAEADEIERDISEFQLALGLTFLLLGIALTGSTLMQVRYGLKPLTQLRSHVSAVREGKQNHIDGEYPSDLAPLAGELNLLIDT
ncbi:MAG: sensor histidine kinase, partial [Beijerinckiaceae bacterium]